MAKRRGARAGLQVFKFGGAALGGPEPLRRVAELVRATPSPLVVVLSAMAGVTEQLEGAAEAAQAGRLDEALGAALDFRRRHLEVVHELVTARAAGPACRELVEEAARELEAIYRGVAMLRELTPRTRAEVVARGERALARIFSAALDGRGRGCRVVDGADFICTHARLGGLWPDFRTSTKRAQALVSPRLRKGEVVVVPGGLARGPDGAQVTLGPGGADFAAAIVARLVRAQSVTLFKDVDGLLTADPRAVAQARLLPELHYREAAELAYYGAKVLHPRTIFPLVEPGIPLFVKSSFNPASAGTRVAADVQPGEYPVKALTAVRAQALVSIEGNGMMGVPGVAGRAFTALSQAGLSVVMISQASSESSICLVVPAAEAASARRVLERAFAEELRSGVVDRVRAQPHVALVAVVGLGMRGTPGIAARTFSALAQARVNVLAIAQGSSELNITVALGEGDVDPALNALHDEFQLVRIRPLPDTQGKVASVALLGFGQIGRALAGQLSRQTRYFRDELGLEMKVVAVADRSGLKVFDEGLGPDELSALVRAKARRRRGAAPRKSPLGKTLEQLEAGIFARPWPRPVLVDVTAEDTADLARAALEHGFHVVLANKKPLAIAHERYQELLSLARKGGLSLRYEATVGAGLPVLDTLAKLKAAGDKVHEITGCLSGTLGYLMTQLEDGVAFSAAVRRARELGYTEPDPRDDLCGMDVARKALILARTLGLRLELEQVKVESLFPPEVSRDDPDAFLEALEALDGPFAERVANARKKGEVLRYVARITRRGVRVGLESVPASGPTGRLRGTDNQVVLKTDRYASNPLVVTGPGAGAEVTAAGVLNDLVAIASEAPAAAERAPAPPRRKRARR